MKELASPPAFPIQWIFRTLQITLHSTNGRVQDGVNTVREAREYRFVSVLERTWFAARAKAAVLLGVAPEELEHDSSR